MAGVNSTGRGPRRRRRRPRARPGDGLSEIFGTVISPRSRSAASLDPNIRRAAQPPAAAIAMHATISDPTIADARVRVGDLMSGTQGGHGQLPGPLGVIQNKSKWARLSHEAKVLWTARRRD